MTTDYGHFLRRGLNVDFHPGLILLNARVLSRTHYRCAVNDGVNRKASECMPLTKGKMTIIRIVDIRIENVTTHPHLCKHPPSPSVNLRH